MEGKLSLQAAEKRVHGLPIDFWSHTKSSTDTLAPCRESKRLSNGQLWDVKVMLADVCRRPL